jgi:hypothetical protein
VKVLRQLGTCGSLLVFGPLLWLGACWASRALSQHAYDAQITPWTRQHRVATAAIPGGGTPVTDRRVRAELGKYLKIWSLEPGACAAFPDAARFPFSLNPFQPKAQFMRLRQKQAFLLGRGHTVQRQGDAWYFAPPEGAALGGRRFRVEADGGALRAAWEDPR